MSTDLVSQVVRCADRLYNARHSGKAIPPIRGELPTMDIAAAYRIQQLNVERRLGAGHRIVGRKIGLTSLAVQKQLGVDQPDFGVLFDDMQYLGDSVTISVSGLIAPRIEAEIAFILKKDIREAGLPGRDLEAAIGEVAASAEIVDSAIGNWEIGIVDTIADNASSGAFALGSPQLYVPGMDLSVRGMRMSSRGDIISTGSGAATLGHPLHALAWLADTAITFGDHLKAGDVILAGALGPMKPFERGEYVVQIDGFPKLTVRAA